MTDQNIEDENLTTTELGTLAAIGIFLAVIAFSAGLRSEPPVPPVIAKVPGQGSHI